MITSTILALAAIAAIVALEIIAMRRGLNGKLLTIAVALIAALGGILVSDAIPWLDQRGKPPSVVEACASLVRHTTQMVIEGKVSIDYYLWVVEACK